MIGSAAEPGIPGRAAVPEEAPHVEHRGVLLFLDISAATVLPFGLIVKRSNVSGDYGSGLLRLLLRQHLPLPPLFSLKKRDCNLAGRAKLSRDQVPPEICSQFTKLGTDGSNSERDGKVGSKRRKERDTTKKADR